MGISFDVSAIEAMPLKPCFEVTPETKAIGGLSITPIANPQQVAGVDYLTACVWAHWRPNEYERFLDLLEEAQLKAKEENADQFCEWNGVLIQVAPSGTRFSGGFPFRFLIEGIQFVVGRKHTPGYRHNMQVTASGVVCMQYGWRLPEIWKRIEELISQLGCCYIDKHTVSRLDVFTDCVGVHVKQFKSIAQRNGFVCRARSYAAFYGIDEANITAAVDRAFKRGLEAVIESLRELWGTVEKKVLIAAIADAQKGAFDRLEFGKTTEDLGFQFGRGSCVCRIYNKIRELEKKHPERLEPMRDAWCIDEKTPVTRVEFQLLSPPLRRRQLKTVYDCEVALPSLTQELCNDWIVGTSKYDGKNKDRREVASVWKRVQNCFAIGFKGDRWKLERVKPEPKDNGDKLARMALGFMTTATARNCGPCCDALDVRETFIQQLDRAAWFAGGWDTLVPKQVHRAAEYTNRLGLPFACRTSREVMYALTDGLSAENPVDISVVAY